MLALARALMSRPRLLLLDEPSMGLAPLVAADVFRILRRLNAEFGLTILLVEQNAKSALKIADRGYILKTGEIVHAGSGKELLDDPLVTAAFLGNSRSRRFDTVSPIVVAG